MEIQRSKEENVTLLVLRGRLDEMATTSVEQVFSEILEAGAKQVLLDLEGVEYVSSSGLRVLLMLAKALQKSQGMLKLCKLSPFVAEVFEISNFIRLFDVHENRAEALAAFGKG